MTKGARLMLSTPPASISSASPVRMARAAMPTASRPEPHSRLTVVPGTLDRQAGQQRAHARDVAVVLAGLVGAADRPRRRLRPNRPPGCGASARGSGWHRDRRRGRAARLPP